MDTLLKKFLMLPRQQELQLLHLTKKPPPAHTRYTASGHALYAVSVTGNFKYTGSTSWFTGASASVTIYDSDVIYVSKSTGYASNYATATGSITYLGDPESHTVTLLRQKRQSLIIHNQQGCHPKPGSSLAVISPVLFPWAAVHVVLVYL